MTNFIVKEHELLPHPDAVGAPRLHVFGRHVTESAADVVPLGRPRRASKGTTKIHCTEAEGLLEPPLWFEATLQKPDADCNVVHWEAGSTENVITVVLKTFDQNGLPSKVTGRAISWHAVGPLLPD